MMDRRLRSREDLSEGLNLPVFAIIKSNSRKNNLGKYGFKALYRRLFISRKESYAK